MASLIRSFGDRWKGGINHYIGWMRDKIIEAHRILKPTGSILLHCDHHANHYLRILLDEIFSPKNFQNEIIWSYGSGGNTKNRFSRKHDNIYWYSKTKKYTFNFKDIAETRGSKKRNNMKKNIDEKGKVFYSIKSAGKIYKYYEDQKLCPSDVLSLSHLQQKDPERIGYKTQKPEKLIEKLIKGISNTGDIVCDFFGGGHTAKVAFCLNRRFLTGDISPVAVRVIKDRLNKAGCKNYIDCNPYLTEQEWRLINGHVFAEKVCEYMGWVVNIKKSGDGGIDGWTDDRKKIPVQIKNSKVNVSVVRDLAGVCNASYKQGIVVGWSFSTGCYEFVSALERKSKIKIELKEAGNIVQPIGYIEKARWQKLYSERIKEANKQPQFIDDRLGKKLKTA